MSVSATQIHLTSLLLERADWSLTDLRALNQLELIPVDGLSKANSEMNPHRTAPTVYAVH